MPLPSVVDIKGYLPDNACVSFQKVGKISAGMFSFIGMFVLLDECNNIP